MSLEKRKILEMVRDDIITIEEATELLSLLEKTDDQVKEKKKKEKSKFRVEFDKELERTKEELVKTKDKLVEKYNSIDTGKIKDKLKKGIEKIDKSVKKIDDAILGYGEKIFKKKSLVEAEETLDPVEDENIDFYDLNKNKEN